MSRERINKFQEYLKKQNLDFFIVSRQVNIRYLCGFSGGTAEEPDGLLIISRTGADFLTDSRYWEQARKEIKGARLIPVKGDRIAALKDLKKFQGKNLKYGFEADYLFYRDKDRIQENLPGTLVIPVTGAVDLLSIIKDKGEVELIQKAVDISDTAFERILGYLKPGLREIEICAELEYQMKMLGSSKPAFETIVASGYRSALPHGLASMKKIARGDFITFDFGATYNGYVSDMTRTIVIGKATSRQKKVYNTVLKAQKAAINKVKSGIASKDVDTAARKIIDKAGYKKYFGHGTGHGIGIYIHVGPGVGPRSNDILKRGMVITIEPGVYIPGWGGVRIEDDVLVTSTGRKVLNSATKNLLEL